MYRQVVIRRRPGAKLAQRWRGIGETAVQVDERRRHAVWRRGREQLEAPLPGRMVNQPTDRLWEDRIGGGLPPSTLLAGADAAPPQLRPGPCWRLEQANVLP